MMNEQNLNDFVKRRWNVFVPRSLVAKSAGRLTGYIDHEAGMICVLGLCLQKPESEDDTFESESECSVGFWHKNDKTSFERVGNGPKTDRKYQVHLLYEDNKMRSCLCGGQIQSDETAICVCMFDPADILNSHLLAGSKLCEIKNSTNLKSPINDENKTNQTIPDVVGERIGHAVYQFQLEKHPPGEHLFLNKYDLLKHIRLLRNIICILPRLALMLLSYVHCTIHLSPPSVRNLLCVPSFSKHLMERCKRSHNVLRLDQKQPFNKLLIYNAHAQYLFESLIGVFVLYHVTTNNMASHLATYILDWADDVASSSTDLIKWLMGAPAGLKLNSQLTSMLGHFFIYHIYLWTGYLVVLRTVLPWLLYFASLAGVLGVSFQLCIVKDIVSMLTIHIYCFYVYAARIFNLQMSALASMWRLFRGKKWNTLRSRVDSAAYNTDQLFVGTLLFTVLLFLLPTTALYYAVFTGLRVITLAFQAVLTHLIGIISVTPVYSLLLCLVRPSWIAGRVEFVSVWLDKPPSNLVLSVKTSQLPLSELINLTAPYLNEATSTTYSWSHFLSCITSGKILYPWMEVLADHSDGAKAGRKTKEQ